MATLLSARRPATVTGRGRVSVRWRARRIRGRRGPVRIREYAPAVEAAAEVVVWVHGGGFVTGNLWMAESHAVALALAASGRKVVTVDYRKVPLLPVIFHRWPIKPSRNSYPGPLDDVVDAYLHVLDRHEGGTVVLGGASAGAHLAAAATIRSGGRAPAGLLLAYGAFHVDLPPFSAELAETLARSKARLPFTPEVTRRYALNYAGSEAILSDPAASPGTAPVDAIPPTLFVNAEEDTLRSSAEAYAERLRDAGKTVTEVHIPGSRHGFLNRRRSASFRAGVDRMIRWLDEELDRPPYLAYG